MVTTLTAQMYFIKKHYLISDCVLWQNNFYDPICDVTVVNLQEDKVFRIINE